MRTLLTAFLLLPIFCAGQATEVDSAYVESLYTKGRSFWYTDQDSAVHYFRIAKDLANRYHFKRAEANALKALGVFAASNHERLQFHIEALEIREQIGDSLGIGISLGDIGSVYRDLREFDKMQRFYQQSLAIRKRIHDYGGIALILIQFGQYEAKLGNFEKALDSFSEALKYRLLARDPNGIAYAHLNLAEIHLKLAHADEALTLATKARQEFEAANNPQGRHLASLKLAEILLYKGRPEHAFDVMREIPTDLRIDFQHLEVKVRFHEVFSRIYEQKKDFNQALQHHKEWIRAKSSLDSIHSSAEARQLAFDYEYKLKEREEQRATELALQQKRRRANLQVLLISQGVLGLFVFLVSMRKRIPRRIMNVLTFVGFLFLFEFLVTLIEPRIQRLTNDEPVMILFGNVLIALGIFPIHLFIERYFRKKIMANAAKQVTSVSNV